MCSLRNYLEKCYQRDEIDWTIIRTCHERGEYCVGEIVIKQLGRGE